MRQEEEPMRGYARTEVQPRFRTLFVWLHSTINEVFIA